MKIILTGSSGRIGRAIFGALARDHEVIGVDTRAFSTTHVITDCADEARMRSLLEGADTLIHTAGPHAPQVGETPDAEFTRVNVEATGQLYDWALSAGATRFLYTSTTALYGSAITPGECTWVDEETPALPKTIYHHTKLAGERALEERADIKLPVRVLRMSRCFPERAPQMASYRLHRGIDARDVGEGHRLALCESAADARADGGANDGANDGANGGTNDGNIQVAPFARFILSGATPFTPEDCEGLAKDAASIIRARAPKLAAAFDARKWELPRTIDRIYDPSAAEAQLGWRAQQGWDEVLAQSDRHDLEVLP